MLYIFLADGFEEVEAIAAIDVIRRAKIEIKTVSVNDNKSVTGTHGIEIICDAALTEVSTCDDLDGIILPGGMPGTTNLLESEKVGDFIDFCNSRGKLIAAICAAPMILGRKGLLCGKRAVCFPGFENELIGALPYDGLVCTHDNFITAKGMGCAVQFGLETVKYFNDDTAANSLEATLQCS